MSCQKYRNAFWVFQMKIESYGNRELMHMGKLELHTGEVHIWKLRWRELETFWEWHKPLLEKEESIVLLVVYQLLEKLCQIF